MSTKQILAALAMLSLVVTAGAAQAGVRRSHDAAWSARTNYRSYEAPWTFACIKDHGTSRCNDLN